MALERREKGRGGAYHDANVTFLVRPPHHVNLKSFKKQEEEESAFHGQRQESRRGDSRGEGREGRFGGIFSGEGHRVVGVEGR